MPFETYEVRQDPEGRRRWESAGRPPVPAVLVGGRVTSLYHPVQLCSILNLPAPATREATRLAWDIVTIVEAWIRRVQELDWGLLTTPTPARGRTLRELIVNVFHPIELLSQAWSTGTFAWYSDRELVESLVDKDTVIRYAGTVHQGWTAFVLETADRDLASQDPVIESPRGALPYSALLSAQRWHAAFITASSPSFSQERG